MPPSEDTPFDTPSDWDDAYANAAHIENADAWLARWPQQAEAYRQSLLASNRAQLDRAYGEHPRELVDVFHPAGKPEGLAMIVHGGYWLRFDAKTFSHLAAGAVERGWLVAMPSYPLCPDVSFDRIARSVSAALEYTASMTRGPIRLAGHSAGGHLVTRQLCPDTQLESAVGARIECVMSISGLHDLRPLQHTSMNQSLRLDACVTEESPALHTVTTDAAIIAWVGSDERPEFIRQNTLLADAWGHDRVHVYEQVGRHHFNVIDDLERADSAMLDCWLGRKP